MFRLHTAVVRRKAGFNSRADLLKSEKRAARPMGGRLACNQEIGVRLPGGPLCNTGSWSNGTTPPWRGGNPGSIPGESTQYGR